MRISHVALLSTRCLEKPTATNIRTSETCCATPYLRTTLKDHHIIIARFWSPQVAARNLGETTQTLRRSPLWGQARKPTANGCVVPQQSLCQMCRGFDSCEKSQDSSSSSISPWGAGSMAFRAASKGPTDRVLNASCASRNCHGFPTLNIIQHAAAAALNTREPSCRPPGALAVR